jgi:hypothetical protein
MTLQSGQTSRSSPTSWTRQSSWCGSTSATTPLAAPTRAPPWAPSSWAASMGVDTPAKPRGVQTATGIAPYPDQQGRGSRIQSRRPRGLQRQTGPGRGQRVMHGVHADVTRRVHVHCQPRDPRHSPDIPLLWQFPSARRHPKSGGRPPTSTRRQSKTRRKWSKSCRKWAKSCRGLLQVFTTGPRLYQGTHL